MIDDQRAYELSRLYIAERIAAAEKEYLLRSVGRRRQGRQGRQGRAHLSEFAAWSGRMLVRVGRRLERMGGAAHTGPSFEMRRHVV